MKKYITIPLNEYQKLNKVQDNVQIKKTKLDKTPDLEDIQTTVADNKKINKTIEDNSLVGLKNKNIPQREDSSSFDDSSSSTSTPAPPNEIESSAGVRGILPPPGIPKNTKSISIIKHNNKKRITRNQGRWVTPWKTRFI